jgi:hypothetical protein
LSGVLGEITVTMLVIRFSHNMPGKSMACVSAW